MKKPVEGHKNLYKDVETGVIHNRDHSDRERYRVAKQQAQMNKNSQIEIDELKKEVKELTGLKEEIEELKELLKAALKPNS